MKTPTSTAPNTPHEGPLGEPPLPGMPLDTRLRTALQSGQSLHGIFCGLPLPALIEMSAFAGFDFVVIDNEHGMAGFETTEHLLRAARASGIAPIVRCFEADIPRVLDAGASGIQIPMVQSPEQAQRLVHSVRYPQPDAMPGQFGMRGSAFSTRAAGYGAFGGPGHTARSNASVACIAMIETPQAVACAGEIAAVPGIDAVFIGPNDLAHTMGHENRWQEEPVQKAIERAVRAISDAGKCPGVLALDAAQQTRYAEWGARYFATVASSVIFKALQEAAGQRADIKY
jgi:4-hydroxy-2-oxoheptanedioate aldolase